MNREHEQARKLWSELSPQKKREYFWDYYRIHVYVGIFVTFLVTVTVHDCATRVDPDITIFYVATELSPEAIVQLETRLSTFIGDVNGDGKTVASVQQVLHEQKLYVTFAAGDIHLLFIRQEEFLRYAANGAFQPLEPLLEEFDIELDLHEYPEIRLTPLEAEKEHLYGIPLENNAVFATLGAAMQDTYLAIPAKGIFGTSDKERALYESTMAIVKEILPHSAQLK